MKKLLAGLLLTLSTTVNAATCEEIEALASSIMTARQSGVPLKQVIAIADGQDYIKRVAMVAYGITNYSTDEYKTKAIEEFADEVYLICLKSTS